MSALYMLDTNISSYIIKGNILSVRKKLLTLPPSQICISSITEAELLYGLEKRPDIKGLKIVISEFLLRSNILPWDEEAAKHYAEIRASLEKKGKTLGNMDMLIAAHALSVQATLVTNDRAFQQLKHLKTENWASHSSAT
ncbi:MAG: hypothetical protein A3I12_02325 [Gammaproteobacteria bacterium RIFCSPLOWO2_02_FULL_38_11]|nr:MAG: hypothetical protein A3I12_02325 [Gammaproteobacteria bacterium RIFCSPLOWO2_02_FULL_38_11]